MEFVDRNDEIRRLERVLNDDSRSYFVVVYGRRRLGKSTLIRHVLKNDDIYYMADMTEQSQQIARLQKKATDLSNPFAKLIQLGYIEREIPFGEDVRSSKKSIYQLSDPFLCTYYKYVVPNRSLIGLNRKTLLMQLFSQSFNEFVGKYWERLCRNVVSGNVLFGTMWNKASRWWGNVKDDNVSKMIEIDVVAESFDKKRILIGECKWTEKENASRLLYELEKKARLLPFTKDKEVVYALFLKYQPEDVDMDNVVLPSEILTIN